MLSLTSKIILHDNRIINFKLPESIKIKAGEYEIVIVLNALAPSKKKKSKLTFSQHDYSLENPNTNFSRNDIYGDFGR